MTTTAQQPHGDPAASSHPMTRQGDTPGALRHAWLLVGLFFFLVNGLGVLYWTAELEMSAGQTVLIRALALMVFWRLLDAECRPYRTTFPLDMAFLLYATSFILLPYYLWRTQRWRGLGKVLLLAALWGATYGAWELAAWLLALQ